MATITSSASASLPPCTCCVGPDGSRAAWLGTTTSMWPDKLAVLPDNTFNEKDTTEVPVALDPAAAASTVDAKLTPLFAPEGAARLAMLRDDFATAKAGRDQGR